jgi:hypothetical protein
LRLVRFDRDPGRRAGFQIRIVNGCDLIVGSNGPTNMPRPSLQRPGQPFWVAFDPIAVQLHANLSSGPAAERAKPSEIAARSIDGTLAVGFRRNLLIIGAAALLIDRLIPNDTL